MEYSFYAALLVALVGCRWHCGSAQSLSKAPHVGAVPLDSVCADVASWCQSTLSMTLK